MKEFKVNNNPFEKSGVLARLPFVGWGILIKLFTIVPAHLLFSVSQKEGEAEGLFILLALLFGIPGLILQFFNITKRLRDIYHRDFNYEKSTIWFIGSLIPFISIIPGLHLTFTRGEITYIDPVKLKKESK